MHKQNNLITKYQYRFLGTGLLGLNGIGEVVGEVVGLVLEEIGFGDKRGDRDEEASCGKSLARPKSATTTVLPS